MEEQLHTSDSSEEDDSEADWDWEDETGTQAYLRLSVDYSGAMSQ